MRLSGAVNKAAAQSFGSSQKLSDAHIQLLSGHASKKSLEMYQHLSLDAVKEAYQRAIK